MMVRNGYTDWFLLDGSKCPVKFSGVGMAMLPKEDSRADIRFI